MKQVCKDFYQAPVIIHIQNCCHTFCSACIRTCFNNNSNNHKIGATGLGGVGNSHRCPICKVEAQEEKIKPVPTMESAVINWQDAREQILKIIERAQSQESQLKELQSLAASSHSKQTALPTTPAEDTAGRPRKTRNSILQQQQAEETSNQSGPKTRAQKARLAVVPSKRKPQEQSARAGVSDDEIQELAFNPTDRKHPSISKLTRYSTLYRVLIR